jgi:hypothetical protein
LHSLVRRKRVCGIGSHWCLTPVNRPPTAKAKELPALNIEQEKKLRQLTIVSMAHTKKVRLYLPDSIWVRSEP